MYLKYKKKGKNNLKVLDIQIFNWVLDTQNKIHISKKNTKNGKTYRF